VSDAAPRYCAALGRSSWELPPFAVGAYNPGAHWFTSFADPAVTVARTLSDTFAGISPASAPAFIAAQVLRMLNASATVLLLYPGLRAVAGDAVLPHGDPGD